MSDDRHAFISYVREDAERVDRLQKILEGAGIRVWRDVDDLWVGEDWRMKIREAITRGSFAFVACFSDASEGKEVSGQREELALAIDQLRLRKPGEPWLLPVRLDDVAIPDVDLGGGRTLRNIQYVDLHGDLWDGGVAKLAVAILKIIGVDSPAPTQATSSLTAQALRDALRDPAGDMVVHDRLMELANAAHDALVDEERFPVSSEVLNGPNNEAALWIADLAEEQVTVLEPLIDAMVLAGAWALPVHDQTLTDAAARIARVRREAPGMTPLTELRSLPMLVVAYATGLAAVRRNNLHALKAVVIDAEARHVEDGRSPVIARLHPFRAFNNFPPPAQVLALRASGEDVTPEVVDELTSGRKGRRHTPVSDFIHDRLRDSFRQLIADDEDYSDNFDRFEALLALMKIDAKTQGESDRVYHDGPYYGRWTWRHRYYGERAGLEHQMQRELVTQADRWPPLEQGLFGDEYARAAAAMDQFVAGSAKVREQRF